MTRTYVLGLEGWSRRSVFGWDDQLGSWWAQLWPDDTTNLISPDIWIADAGGQVSQLVRLVADRAAVATDIVDWAFAESIQPPPERTWPLCLAGWTQRSTISWDPTAGWSAHLWADDTTGAYPDIQIRSAGHERSRLVRAIAEHVMLPVDFVDAAVAAGSSV